ncbi:hypothetical protein GCM10020220_083910 [Nonomuraea rubra]|uniref:hypothetical protein n=1 Tax=Nonomuraea rubra TaxID=46180 RepID=UPI0031E9CCE7
MSGVARPARVGFRCDAGVKSGVGHLVRCVALAEELCARGAEVFFLGEVCGSAWARAQLRERGLPLVPAPREPARLAALACELRLDAVVLDSYDLPAGTGAALRDARFAVLALVDGDPLGQEADLYLDQNLGAERRPFPLPAERLAGARYALLRDSVRRRSRAVPGGNAVPRVLCFFGGTDSGGVAPAWARALSATGRPFLGTVVSPEPFEAAGPITVIPPTDRLPELMAAADLVVTAAGSAVWELLYLGRPDGVDVGGGQPAHRLRGAGGQGGGGRARARGGPGGDRPAGPPARRPRRPRGTRPAGQRPGGRQGPRAGR